MTTKAHTPEQVVDEAWAMFDAWVAAHPEAQDMNSICDQIDAYANSPEYRAALAKAQP